MYQKFIKRPLDIILSLVGGIVLFLPMVIVAIIIKTDSKGPVFFVQEREGKDHQIFKMYKFRTMCANAYEQGGVVTDEKDPRITKIGFFLRRSNIDELPQLLNIIKGDMAVIGPRAILKFQYDAYRNNMEYEKRFSVRPGLFCTAAVVDEEFIDRTKQFETDAQYAENISFMGDFVLFLKMVKMILCFKKVHAKG